MNKFHSRLAGRVFTHNIPYIINGGYPALYDSREMFETVESLNFTCNYRFLHREKIVVGWDCFAPMAHYLGLLPGRRAP